MLDRDGLELTELTVGEPTIFVAPIGTPPPTLARVLDADGPWRLLHPAAPDYPPED